MLTLSRNVILSFAGISMVLTHLLVVTMLVLQPSLPKCVALFNIPLGIFRSILNVMILTFPHNV